MNDISFVHGVGLAQQFIQQKLDFVNVDDLLAELKSFKAGDKTPEIAEKAIEGLRELAVPTNNFQDVKDEHLGKATTLFASFYFEKYVNMKGLEELNFDQFSAGAKEFWAKQEMPSTELIQAYSEFMADMQAKEGNDFLAENGKKEGITTTESGLQYEVISAGEGDKPNATSNVTVHYEGTLLDGSVFDSSYQRGETISFGLNQVIPGWTEGLQLMSPGAKYKFYIPYNLAYGERGSAPKIPPFAALIFTVELFSFE